MHAGFETEVGETRMDVAVVGIIGGIIGSAITYLIHREGRSVKMVEIAAGILAAKPDPSSKALRDWAVNILVNYTPRKCLLAPKPRKSFATDLCQGFS
jgi:hypothetical protein